MAGRMWGGTRSWMGWMPAPSSGIQKTLQGYAETIDLQNGGVNVKRSYAAHAVYDLNFPVENASNDDGLSIFNKLANGYYGETPVFFADPLAKDSNLFAPNWASPALIERGDWKNIYPFGPIEFSNANAPYMFDMPRRQATWQILNDPGTSFNSRYRHVIPVPENDVLWVGSTGSSTGTGTVIYKTFKAGVEVETFYYKPVAATNPLRTGLKIPNIGGAIDYVEVTFGKQDYADATLTILSMDAKLQSGMIDRYLYPSDDLYPSDGLYMENIPIPTSAIGRHFVGEGNMGLEFSDNAVVETYIMENRRLKGLSTRLVEVGSWQ